MGSEPSFKQSRGLAFVVVTHRDKEAVSVGVFCVIVDSSSEILAL